MANTVKDNTIVTSEKVEVNPTSVDPVHPNPEMIALRFGIL